ncbi:MAG: SDR family NAD(P)-dependent oxidoreductase [Asgard group archaeon]|nr:SDR family NAD(P)-dependent oxidoreductase [Asgard group archaeon]
MSSISNDYVNDFGPWALIAGASEGLGEAFAREIASKGINVALIARRKDLLEKLCKSITQDFNVETRAIQIDLARNDVLKEVIKLTKDIEIGLVIYNAALSPIGLFYNFDLDKHYKVIDVNVKGPMIFAHHFGQLMKEREKGGIVLLSSLAGLQGDPYHAHYSATRGYTMNLAEALWYEMKKYNVKVMACVAGATNTPNYKSSKPKRAGLINPKPMDPNKVAKGTLKSLKKNQPFHIPGFNNRFNSFILRKLLRRKQAIRFMGNIASKMYGENKNHINK